jgi:hypothetical protein
VILVDRKILRAPVGRVVVQAERRVAGRHHHPAHAGVLGRLFTSKALGGGKASISAYVAREPVFRRAYENLERVLSQGPEEDDTV